MRILRFAPLLALLAACSDTSGPGDGSLRLNAFVDQDAAPGEPNVEITIQNRGAFPVLLDRCGQRVMMVVDRRENGGWGEYMGDVCHAAVGEEPLTLAPGASTTTTRSLEESGEYRIRLEPWTAGEPGERRTVASPKFEVQ